MPKDQQQHFCTKMTKAQLKALRKWDKDFDKAFKKKKEADNGNARKI
jgi:hypothetical protein